MTSSPHALYALGYTHATMATTMGRHSARGSQSHKRGLSSDRRLQLACVKLESLVTAGQPHCGEYVLGPCTHRPSHHESRFHPKPAAQPAREGAVEGGVDDWGEVVTTTLRPPLATVGAKLGYMLEHPQESCATRIRVTMRQVRRTISREVAWRTNRWADPSETTRRAPGADSRMKI